MEKSAVGVGDGGRADSESRENGGSVTDRGVGGWAERMVGRVMLVSRTGRREGPACGLSSIRSGSGVECAV